MHMFVGNPRKHLPQSSCRGCRVHKSTLQLPQRWLQLGFSRPRMHCKELGVMRCVGLHLAHICNIYIYIIYIYICLLQLSTNQTKDHDNFVCSRVNMSPLQELNLQAMSSILFNISCQYALRWQTSGRFFLNSSKLSSGEATRS